MEKRYQVFISSTFLDLQAERQEVIQALLELDCIPAGMELFPAANDDQWTLIKKVIDDSDYYMVILAGRYGSMGPSGLSYTEMEYRYALEIGKPVLGFLHKDPSSISAKNTESSEDGRQKLEEFRDLVRSKVCRFWESPIDLGSQVSRSLIKLIKEYPAIGWVRGDLIPSESANAEILSLRRTIDELKDKLSSISEKAPEGSDSLAHGSDLINIKFTFAASPDKWSHNGRTYNSEYELTWDDIFSSIAPLLINEANEASIKSNLNNLTARTTSTKLKTSAGFASLNLMDFEINNDDFQTIKVQLRALGLITRSLQNHSIKDHATYWTLTPYGDNQMLRLRAIHR
jgi:hypothetical protein